ncbi:MAG: ribonuclease HI family protein [Rhodoferax sp.]|nr:ribonuclease HI family protein [Rhodoferax sp.]
MTVKTASIGAMAIQGNEQAGNPQLWSVYIDASVVPNPGRMRIGGIAYSPEGHSSSFSLLLNHTGCNNEAEALAAIHALEWLATQNAQHVVLYTDNSILAEQLSLPNPKQIARLAAVYEKARSTLKLFTSVQMRWIPRHKNALADALARGE